MLEELVMIHGEVMNSLPTKNHRYIWNKINWDTRALCIYGDRGVGKTTLMCQYLLEHYQQVEHALYLSADNINVISNGLWNIVKTYFSHGGKAIFIDEVHKYPNWSIEIKNILDTYKKHQVIFSGSSAIDLQGAKGDLSRRVVYYKLSGLSFREYLKIQLNLDVPMIHFDDLIKNHVSFAEQFRSKTILKHFNDYLQFGYYPYFVEGTEEYFLKLNNVIEKIIFEDVAVVYNLKQATLNTLKKLLWIVTNSGFIIPNIDSISKNFGVSREIIYDCIEYLSKSGLLYNLYHDAEGMKFVRKPGKIQISNTNLLHAINGSLKIESNPGGVREIFFVNQVCQDHKIRLHEAGDYIVNDQYVIEVGGKSKTRKQINKIDNAYLALDDIEIGFANKIPLYLFGFLY